MNKVPGQQRLKAMASLSLAILACGCSTFSADRKPAVMQSGFLLEELSPRNLKVGECGLFLWQVSKSRPLVFFAPTDAMTAVVKIQGKEHALILEAIGAEQKVEGEKSLLVRAKDGSFKGQLTLDQGDGFSGERERSFQGQIKLTTETDWILIAPVAGVVGCA